MKKLLLVLPIVFSYAFAGAQVRFGVKAGYNLSTLVYSGTLSLDGEKPLSGFNTGLFASIPFSETFSLEPELVYSQQGGRFQTSAAHGQFNYNYLNIPVLIRYTLPVGLFFETGLQMGILLSASETNNGNTFSIMYNTYSEDFALPIGLGYQMPDKHFGVDLRYNLGLINILKSNSDVNVKNSVFQFGVFYAF